MQLIFRLKITLSKLLSTIINPIRKTVYTKKNLFFKNILSIQILFLSLQSISNPFRVPTE